MTTAEHPRETCWRCGQPLQGEPVTCASCREVLERQQEALGLESPADVLIEIALDLERRKGEAA